YSMKFLNKLKSNNLITVFHNEKHDINSRVILPIKKQLAPGLCKMYSDRTVEESLIVLQYPVPGSGEMVYMQFFDSPFCASSFHRSFKGVFVVDCSTYEYEDTDELNRLIKYIKDNYSDNFKFIVLFSSDIKEEVLDLLDSQAVPNSCAVNLELDDAFIETYKSDFDSSEYANLRKLFKKEEVKTQSLTFVSEVIENAVKHNEEIEEIRSKLSAGYKNSKRKIGF
nr:hypothetical protein [Clostridiales bacterium]